MPGPIITLARTFLRQPTHVRAEENDASAVHERTRQFVYRAHSLDKIEIVARALQADGRGLTMIFAKTKRTAQKISDDLTERGFAVAAVHGDLGQGAREQSLRAFRSGKVDVLVSTDVAARGLDVDDVTHVINYQCPEDEGTYIHRIGRTGRAGKEGVAITLVDWDDEARWKLVSDGLSLDIPVPVETYSTSEHLFSDLGIPADSSGRLPLAKRTRAGLDAEPEENFGRKKRTGGRTAAGRRTRGQSPARTEAGPERPRRDEDDSTAASRPRRRRRRGGVPENGQPAETPERQDGAADRQARSRRRRRNGVEVTPPNTGDTPGAAD
jgi:superfamily II DNA/RNA helicase